MPRYTFPEDVKEKNRQIAITIEERRIVKLEFLKRPALSSSQKKHYRGSHACHRVSVEVIKQEFIKEYLGKTLDNANYPCYKRTTDSVRIHMLGSSIVRKYKVKVRAGSNLFKGDMNHNNFAGKLVMLLKPIFIAGEGEFNRNLQANDGKYSVAIPCNARLGNDRDAYSTIRKELGADVIELSSWMGLCSWYFCANYDESPDHDEIEKINSWRRCGIGTKKIENKNRERDNKRRKKAMARFKNTYDLHGVCGSSLEHKGAEEKGAGLSFYTNKRKKPASKTPSIDDRSGKRLKMPTSVSTSTSQCLFNESGEGKATGDSLSTNDDARRFESS